MVSFLIRVKKGLLSKSKRARDASEETQSADVPPCPSPSEGPCRRRSCLVKLTKLADSKRKVKKNTIRYDIVYDQEDKDEVLLASGDDRRLLKDAIFMGLVGHTMGVFCLTYSIAVRVLGGSALLVILSDPLLLLLVGLVALIDFLIFQALFLL